ncbi:flagellar hook-length control protein FliK [Heliophilum fasciatum]|uniref:Flagellar hook-length control protein FliK n=1 Tax=Heliophilum fasciatum TaxID=35700 RepID=A0A4R2RWX3_9FIRM|nr:flagellar hook-length control protein FliK [Heliophilum fasciatum]MCW2277939.1 flagellar hook-length control protein FliK [Heliophilum fasciatum]TCP64491.1 flagellar hook-length control protein FliK [Heliophilum fasciatum]
MGQLVSPLSGMNVPVEKTAVKTMNSSSKQALFQDCLQQWVSASGRNVSNGQSSTIANYSFLTAQSDMNRERIQAMASQKQAAQSKAATSKANQNKSSSIKDEPQEQVVAKDNSAQRINRGTSKNNENYGKEKVNRSPTADRAVQDRQDVKDTDQLDGNEQALEVNGNGLVTNPLIQNQVIQQNDEVATTSMAAQTSIVATPTEQSAKANQLQQDEQVLSALQEEGQLDAEKALQSKLIRQDLREDGKRRDSKQDGMLTNDMQMLVGNSDGKPEQAEIMGQRQINSTVQVMTKDNLLTQDGGIKGKTADLTVTNDGSKGVALTDAATSTKDIAAQGAKQTAEASTATEDRYEIIRQIVDQVKGVHKPGSHEMQIRLKPEFLGNLDVRVRMEGAVFTAQFIADNPQVKQLIESQLDQLRQSLEDMGLRFDSLDVGLNDRGMGQQYPGDQQGLWTNNFSKQSMNGLERDFYISNEETETTTTPSVERLGSTASIEYLA